MSRRRIRSAVLAAAGAAALFGAVVALSPSAAADPATLPSPALPGINVVRQFVSAADIPQVLQSAASALSGAPSTPATPTPTPLASAAVTVPQLPLTPAAAPQTSLTGAAPTVPTDLSKMLGLSGGLPTDLSSLMSGLGAMSAAGTAAPSAATPVPTGFGIPLPTSALP
jgi:hypothetical protein